MKNSAAKRLAKALIDAGRENKTYEAFGEELKAAVAVFRGNPELCKALLNPMYKLEQRKALIEKIAAGLEFSTRMAKFLDILVETRSVKLLEDISEAYSKLEDELAGRLRAVIEAPSEPAPALVEGIKEKISRSTGRQVILSYRKNDSLLGGVVIRMENTILDGSLKTQLELMKEKILEGVV